MNKKQQKRTKIQTKNSFSRVIVNLCFHGARFQIMYYIGSDLNKTEEILCCKQKMLESGSTNKTQVAGDNCLNVSYNTR